MDFVLVEALSFGLSRLVAAAEKLNANLHLLTRDKNVYFHELASVLSKNFVVTEIDSFNQAEILAYCRGLKNFAGLINLTDTWTDTVRQLAAKLGCRGQNPLSMQLCRNKFLLRKTLAGKGLSRGLAHCLTPREAEAKAGDFIYPLIIKDPRGTGSRNVWFADNARDLTALMAFIKQRQELPEILLETYFKGTLYSAETLSFAGETRLLAFSGRILSDMPYFKEKAAALPVPPENPELRGAALWIDKILAALCYSDGFAHTEFMVTEQGFEAVEVNPRLGGALIGEALCQAYDYNIYQAFFEMALGRKPELFEKPLKPQAAVGQVLLYAEKKGVFSGLKAPHCRAKTKIYPCAAAGQKIENLDNQSACVAIVLAQGASSETALLNAFAEANRIEIMIDSADG